MNDYETFLKTYPFYSCDDEESMNTQREEAKYLHALQIQDELLKTSSSLQSNFQHLQNKNANYYFRFGVLRRMLMLFRSYQCLVGIAYEGRKKPLIHEESCDLGNDINLLYINILGILDNIAWVILFERMGDQANIIEKRKVHLLCKEVLNNIKVGDKVLLLKDWINLVKEKRNPVAHRIPLTVPPSFLLGDEANKYNEIFATFWENLGNGKLAETDKNLEDMENIGTFVPCFQHHPDDGIIPIYPTIPNDVAHIIEVCNIFLSEFQSK